MECGVEMGLTCRCILSQAVNVTCGQLYFPQQPELQHQVVSPNIKGCKWVQKQVSGTLGVTVQEMLWEHGVTDIHKSLEHYPKVVLPVV